MKLSTNLEFELGHQNIQEWLVFAIPILAILVVVVGIILLYYSGFFG